MPSYPSLKFSPPALQCSEELEEWVLGCSWEKSLEDAFQTVHSCCYAWEWECGVGCTGKIIKTGRKSRALP